jgi:prephenate dehydrogenase
MKKIAIVGVGLIGGSLGMALKDKSKIKNQKLKIKNPGPRYRIIGVGRHIEKLKLAKKLGAVDEYTTDFTEGAKNADIVVIGVPVDKIAPITKRILKHLKPDTVLTDVGSVKKSIVTELQKVFQSSNLKSSIVFVGGHPLAGSEKSGVKYACGDIFKNATVVLTPSRKTSVKAIKTIYDVWRDTGAKVLTMSPEQHDKLVAMTSHLPHIISAGLVSTVAELYGKDARVRNLIAGSFRDMTRITDSDPSIWASILQLNRKEILNSLGKFQQSLLKVKSILSSASSDKSSMAKLYNLFGSAKNERNKLIHDD